MAFRCSASAAWQSSAVPDLALIAASRLLLASWHSWHRPCLFVSSSLPPAHRGMRWSSTWALVVRPAVSQYTQSGCSVKWWVRMACRVSPRIRVWVIWFVRCGNADSRGLSVGIRGFMAQSRPPQAQEESPCRSSSHVGMCRRYAALACDADASAPGLGWLHRAAVTRGAFLAVGEFRGEFVR